MQTYQVNKMPLNVRLAPIQLKLNHQAATDLFGGAQHLVVR